MALQGASGGDSILCSKTGFRGSGKITNVYNCDEKGETLKFYRYQDDSGGVVPLIEIRPGHLLNLGPPSPIGGFEDLLGLAQQLGSSPEDLMENLMGKGPPATTPAELESRGLRLLSPLVPKEVWAAGVTYGLSRDERQKESSLPEVYARVFRSERPEVFFKATAERCVGPFDAIGIRGDSNWNVPEAELAFVLYQDEIVGYTIGNDVSSRSIEGENPLYLPQAKIYDRCCAIGPCVVTPAEIPDPHKLTVQCEIIREGNTIFSEQTSTAEMVRTCQELARVVRKHNPLPDGTVVLTGTGLVPPENISLLAGDRVKITIEKIGTLENPVIEV